MATRISPNGRSWQNVPGLTSIEFDDCRPVPFDLAWHCYINNIDCGELVIHWLSSGYHEPASVHGGPDHLGWPAEGSEDRELEYAELDGVKLPQELAAKLFDEFFELTESTD